MLAVLLISLCKAVVYPFKDHSVDKIKKKTWSYL